MSSYTQYPYIEHFSPSSATSTPHAFAQWDIQDNQNNQQQQQQQSQQQQQQETTVSPLQQALPISEPSPPTATATYEPPKTIQLTERPPRRSQITPSTPARDTAKYPLTPQTNPPAGGKWFDVRESSKSKGEKQSAAGAGVGVGPLRSSATANTQRSHARFASHPYMRALGTNAALNGAGVGEGKARSCRYDSPSAVSPTVMACATTPEYPRTPDPASPSSPSSPTSPLPSPPPRKFLIRTDVYFSPSANQHTAMLELPGVKKANLRLSLGLCPYSQVMQLTVWGRSSPAFLSGEGAERDGEHESSGGYTVRERKYGEFRRVLVVPPETTAEKVKATLEDGILTLTYPAGKPTRKEESATIAIN